jgi:predicted DNA-binding transcriptional regulator AlpA
MASDIKIYKSITQVAEGCGKSRQWFYDRRRFGQSLPPAEHDGYGLVWWVPEKVTSWFKEVYPDEGSHVSNIGETSQNGASRGLREEI